MNPDARSAFVLEFAESVVESGATKHLSPYNREDGQVWRDGADESSFGRGAYEELTGSSYGQVWGSLRLKRVLRRRKLNMRDADGGAEGANETRKNERQVGDQIRVKEIDSA